MKPLSECRLYGILDTCYVAADRLTSTAFALVSGGVDILQLRAKGLSRELVLGLARDIAPICRGAGVPFILNDHPDLVAEAGADGAHVGQEDMTVAEARLKAGPGALIGRSTHSPEQARATTGERPDYIGYGPLFPTPTKPDYIPVGTDSVAEVVREAGIPVFCIGGVREANLPLVVAAGADRVAIVSDLLLAEDPGAKAAACRRLLPD